VFQESEHEINIFKIFSSVSAGRCSQRQSGSAKCGRANLHSERFLGRTTQALWLGILLLTDAVRIMKLHNQDYHLENLTGLSYPL